MTKEKTKICKECKSEIPKNASRCKHCGAKQPRPFWKRPWFYIIVLLIFFIAGQTDRNNDHQNSNGNTQITKTKVSKTEKEPIFNYLEIENLSNGKSYIVSKNTPLMPELSPADPLKSLEKMKSIPKNGYFSVLNNHKKGNAIWYEVKAFDNSDNMIGVGFINSTALIGQDIKEKS